MSGCMKFPMAYMTIGVAGAGKSTYLEQHVIPSLGRDHVIINTDRLLYEFAEKHGVSYLEAFNRHVTRAVWQSAYELHEASYMGRDIVIDGTNLQAENRKHRLFLLAQDYYKVALYFPRNPTWLHRVRRMRGEGKEISADVIEHMLSILEPPTEAEGFDAIVYVSQPKGGPE